jgi:hypothetical protein
MALILRYRQGTRVDIDANPFDALREFLSHQGDPGFPLVTLAGAIRQEFWDQWSRPDAASTWFALLREFFQIHPEETRAGVWPAQLRVLDAVAPGGSAEEIWARARETMLSDLEQLTGWDHSIAKASAMLWRVQRADDGTYFHEEDGERTEVLGARTLAETLLEYVTEDCVRKYGHVGRMCRLVTLFCLHASFERHPGDYPTTIRVTLNEDSYLQWSWYSLSPLGSRRVPWRPPDRHSEPESLGIEIAARYEERHSIERPPEARKNGYRRENSRANTS